MTQTLKANVCGTHKELSEDVNQGGRNNDM